METLQPEGETNSLAILVSSDRHPDQLVSLTRAAWAKGKRVSLFFTGQGVRLTTTPQFAELQGKARIAVCDFSFRANGLKKEAVPGPGIHFTTQAAHAKMLKRAERYLVL